MTHTLTVELGDRSYPIVIGRGLLGGGFDLAPYVRGEDCLVVSNETVAPLYLDRLLPNLGSRNVSSISLPDGEAYKTLGTMTSILDKLVDAGAGRDTTVIALGGGVVGDIAGFAAACYMRGVNFVQVPTTLLAQVDSSVGGKTGVNHEQGKNMIGAFHQPQVVLIDTDTLTTLPDRELRAGLAFCGVIPMRWLTRYGGPANSRPRWLPRMSAKRGGAPFSTLATRSGTRLNVARVTVTGCTARRLLPG